MQAFFVFLLHSGRFFRIFHNCTSESVHFSDDKRLLLCYNKHILKSYGEIMFNKLFDPQNTFWHWVGKTPAVLVLSMLWFLMCLPIITIVPATAALYDAVSRNLRADEPGIFSRYFSTFVKELKRGIILSILTAAIAFLLFYVFQILEAYAQVDDAYSAWTLVFQVSLMLPVGVFLWMVTLESRFVYSFFGLLKNAFIFFFAFLPQTLLIVLLFVACIVLCWLYIPLLFFMPALMMLLISFPVEHIFRDMIAKREAQEQALQAE